MYTIRRATIEDIHALVRLRVAMQTETTRPRSDLIPVFAESTRCYLEEHLPTERFLAWVAEGNEGEGIIGTSGLVFLQRPPTFSVPSGLDAYVLNMYTLPDWRGRGVAAAILDVLITYVRNDTNAGRILLHSQPEARTLYMRAGFSARHDEMELLL